PLFQGYIAISPELPANIETILPEKLAQLQKDTYYYYLATADGDVDRIRKSAVQLDGLIKPIDNKSLKYRYDNFGNASHYSLVPMAIPQAVYHIFGEYQPISSVEYQTKIATLQSGYVDYLKAKYAQLDKNLGLEVPVRINDLKAIEAAIMKNGMFEELKELAKIAKKNYPKTIIGEYYEGLYYEKTGNTQKAIKIYLNGYTFSSIADYTKEFMVEKAQALKTE
ncbi:histidine kinase, partial [Nostoc linckia z15]